METEQLGFARAARGLFEVLHPVADLRLRHLVRPFLAGRRLPALAELVRQLPAGYQMVFNLHAIEGYSHVEIGKMLGINEGTSRSQYARARALLISWLKKTTVETQKDSYVRP